MPRRPASPATLTRAQFIAAALARHGPRAPGQRSHGLNDASLFDLVRKPPTMVPDIAPMRRLKVIGCDERWLDVEAVMIRRMREEVRREERRRGR